MKDVSTESRSNHALIECKPASESGMLNVAEKLPFSSARISAICMSSKDKATCSLAPNPKPATCTFVPIEPVVGVIEMLGTTVKAALPHVCVVTSIIEM